MRKVAILFFLAFSFLTTSGVASAEYKAGDPNPDVPTSYVRGSDIDNIKKIIGEKTPDVIAKPVIAAVQAIEKFRIDMAEKSEGKFYNFIFSNPYVFYVIFFIIFIFVLRTIWRIIFWYDGSYYFFHYPPRINFVPTFLGFFSSGYHRDGLFPLLSWSDFHFIYFRFALWRYRSKIF